MLKNKKKILLTGGHAGTTALNVVKEIKSRKNGWEIHWVGSKIAVEGNSNALTLETRVFTNLDVKSHTIVAGKLQKKWSRYTLLSLVKVPIGIVHALILIVTIKPDLILSFGGYVGVPVVIAGYLFRIPVVLHEQITGLGLANRLSVPFASVVTLAREEGIKYAKGKGVVVGNPINKEFAKIKKRSMGFPPTLFIFPGSRGSQIINSVIEDLLPKLIKDFYVIHLSGNLDFEHFSELREKLSLKEKKRYEVMDFIKPKNVPKYYEKSDILIGRAGANTVSEIMASGIPSILIPLTWTNYQDQVHNANAAKKRGIAVVINNDELNKKALYESIVNVKKNWKKMTMGYKKDLSNLDINAASVLVDKLEGVISES